MIDGAKFHVKDKCKVRGGWRRGTYFREGTANASWGCFRDEQELVGRGD